MLKVNEEKLLQDARELVNKKSENLAKIEAEATAYANQHGYSEDKTAKFVKFTQELEGNGLSADESVKLEILSSYIDEQKEAVVEEGLKCNIVLTDENGAIADSTVATVQNI